LKTANLRLQESNNLLKEELEITRREKDRLLKEEHEHYLSEIEKLKADHLLLMQSLHDKNVKQNEEIQRLLVSNVFAFRLLLD
jgi:hypothetical protein